jgi:N-methylhydantoinase A
MPISVPVIEMVEIGAGGGSLAHVDGMRQIRVGPESAGSEPGPACYQRGGARPTVTDANLVLGRLDPDNFAGGDIVLSAARAQAALQAHIGAKLELESATSAIGICEMVDENMANAARVHAVENGRELSDYTMIAYGGGAPLHACRLCEKLGISEMLVPPGAGVGSAIGFLRAPFGYEAVRGAFVRLSSFDPAFANEILDSLADESMAIVRAGSGNARLLTERKVYMRYRGQGWEIAVRLPNEALGAEGGEKLRSLFEAQYARLFGSALAGLDIEILNWSVRVVSETPEVSRVTRGQALREVEGHGRRRIYDPRSLDFLEAAIVNRHEMAVGARVSGPAAIVERETTTIVTAAFEAVMQPDGCLLLTRKGSDHGE